MGGLRIMEYVYFYTEEAANTFLINCLSKGIYCKKTYNMEMIGVEIDVEKTCKEKNKQGGNNAKTNGKTSTSTGAKVKLGTIGG